MLKNKSEFGFWNLEAPHIVLSLDLGKAVHRPGASKRLNSAARRR